MKKPEDVIGNANYLIVKIIAIQKTHDIFMNRYIKDSDIKPSQYYMLHYLHNVKELNQSEIAACCFMDRCGVSRAFKEFEEKGLITREATEGNKRQYDISLTEKGLELAEFFSQKEKEWEEEISKKLGISLEDINLFLQGLAQESIDFNKASKK